MVQISSVGGNDDDGDDKDEVTSPLRGLRVRRDGFSFAASVGLDLRALTKALSLSRKA
jgi:hypothetical protein